MTNAEKLKRVRYLISRYPRAVFALERARSSSTRITTVISDMPKGGGKGGDESMIANIDKLIAAEQSLKRLRDELQELRQWLKPLIAQIDGTLADKVRAVMQMRYIDGMSARDIADAMYYSERRVFELLNIGEKFIGG